MVKVKRGLGNNLPQFGIFQVLGALLPKTSCD